MDVFKSHARVKLLAMALLLLTIRPAGAAEARSDEARVTRIIRDVRLVPSKAKSRPAELNDKVTENTAVRTGDQSRSELTFVDLTIERLGANSIFSFSRAGRSVELDSGSMLMRVPKNSGGAAMVTTQLSVAISGTTLILDSSRSGRNKLTVLEGGARVALRKYPRESAAVLGGQMIDVPPNATKLPPVINVDLNQIMKTNPLITDFGPLPSRDLIAAQANQPPGGPRQTGPGFLPTILTSVANNVGVAIGSGSGRTGGKHTATSGHGRTDVPSRTNASTMKNAGGHPSSASRTAASAKPHSSPTPKPKRKPHDQ